LNVVLISAHRNTASSHLRRWLNQVDALQAHLTKNGVSFRAVAVEGDSTDKTRRELQWAAACRPWLEWSPYDHGGPPYGSTEEPARMAQLSGVANAMLDCVRPTDDIFVYVESDLIWDAETIFNLVRSLEMDEYANVMAPLVFAGPHFYDVWGFRGLDGDRFSPFHPYHRSAQVAKTFEVASIGSCFAAYSYLATDKTVRMSDGALVEWCALVRCGDWNIYVDPLLHIQHPA
jgi:hypothetical protein